MKRRAFISCVPGAAQHERSEVMRCRPGTVTNSAYGTVPDQRCTTRATHSRCTTSGTHEINRRAFITLLGAVAARGRSRRARSRTGCGASPCS
jgi:hypothetical protein